ncbi:MAG TPA: isoprenylcysteine carboxylmethyltransferase family protein [Bryobacteraceae bacterium]|nr:isoprenylcysteine carboxylmethyltransferase family protein [Bryobacteraceae bacterium]
MLWLRGLIFTILVPGVVAYWAPRWIDPGARRAGGWWDAGWVLVAAGTLIYGLCLLRFLAAGGTPAIFFTRPLGALIGEEPARLVAGGLYGYSRNPMYLGVLMAVFGQAIVYASRAIAEYGVAVFVTFHLVVVLLEEPHLRATRGLEYENYCKSVPRWIGRPRGSH